MMPSYRIVFYISGHGFGHAARSLEVIRALTQRRPHLAITVKSAGPAQLFRDIESGAARTAPLEIIAFQADTGMLQIDSLRLDAAGSIRQAAAFHADLPQKAEAEGRFLKEHRADLVVGDIPPLAFAAAASAGLPSVALGNFTWDWIYAEYPETSAGLLNALQEAYAHASLALRLPMAGGFESLRSRTQDIPFVARTSERDPVEVRQALGLPVDKPMVLMSFGAYGLKGLDLARLGRLRDYTIVTGDFPDSGFQYQDLVRAADVVVTKPGYGIISECIANHTAMLYTSRGHFREYDVLVGEMPKYLRTTFIDQHDLLAGRWGAPLERLLASPRPAVTPPVNGADVAAEDIIRLLS